MIFIKRILPLFVTKCEDSTMRIVLNRCFRPWHDNQVLKWSCLLFYLRSNLAWVRKDESVFRVFCWNERILFWNHKYRCEVLRAWRGKAENSSRSKRFVTEEISRNMIRSYDIISILLILSVFICYVKIISKWNKGINNVTKDFGHADKSFSTLVCLTPE